MKDSPLMYSSFTVLLLFFFSIKVFCFCRVNKTFFFECLEPQFLEEPSVLSGLVSILELQSDGMTCLFALNWILQIFRRVLLIQSNVRDTVTCWHHMIVVDHLKTNFIEKFRTKVIFFSREIYLNERLYLGFLMNLRLIHSASHTFRVAIDSSYQCVSELLVGSSIIECF